jgi:eukaryotic-like serine/threonine-protein kinase
MVGAMAMSQSTSGPDLFNVLADEFADRHRRGEQPPLSEYTDKYPELADQIRELFPALVAMEKFGSLANHAAGACELGPPSAGPIPERLGDYRILREIARGGMGIVYEAMQESLGRHVALKVLPQYRLRDPSQLERFQREARAAAMLHHTNIVPVFGVGEHSGVHHYAMQYIQGQSLDVVLREVKRMRDAKPEASRRSSVSVHDPVLAASVAAGLVSGRFGGLDGSAAETVDLTASRTPPTGQDSVSTTAGMDPAPSSSASSILGQSGFPYYRSVARIGVQAAEALAYAHQHKLLHRDIKPSNLLLDLQGTVWITDFGLAKAEGTDGLTQTGDIVGTLRYMAPERFRGLADARSDIYALGLTLYEMLTLEPAFAADEKARLIDKILHEAPSNPRQLAPRIPRDLETITLKAMAREPSERYLTAAELAEDLRRYLADRTILARRASAFEQGRRWCRRNRWVAAAIATVAAALVIVAALALRYADRQRHFGLEQKKAREKITALAENLEMSLAESNRLLAVRSFDRGQAAFEKDQIGPGLLWMIESWRAAAAAGDSALQYAARGNLSAWLPYHARLKAVLSHPSPVEDAAFSPDGKTIITGGDDGTARLWDAATGRPIGPTVQHPREVTSVAFSPDGRSLLTCCRDGKARLWDAAIGRLAGPPLPHQGEGSVTALFSPDGKSLVIGFPKGTARLWDAATGQPVGPTLQTPAGTYPAAFHADGKSVVFASIGTWLQLWDAVTGRPVGPNVKNALSIRSAALSPDGKNLLIGSSDGTARFWDLVTGQPLSPPMKGHDDRVRDVAFSPDGGIFLTGSTDKTARLWDAFTGEPIGLPLQHQGPVVAVSFSPDGNSFLTASSDFTVRVWDADVYEPVGLVLEQPGGCTAVAFSPDGKLILAGGADGSARLWNAPDGRQLGPALRHAGGISDHAAGFSPDGKIALTGSEDKTARMWAVPSGGLVGPPLAHEGQVWAVAFSPDGKTIFTGSDDRTVRLWDAATGTLLGTPIPQPDAVNAMAISPDGKTLVAGYGLGAVQLWDVATRTPMGKPFPHPGSIETVAFSPDGASVLTGCEDGMARLWDVAGGTLLLPPLATGSWIWGVAFSVDGRLLAAGNSNSVRLWDSATGQPIGPILAHPGPAHAMVFSPDGKTLLTACADGKARLFSRAPEVPDGLDRIANWVEVLTGQTLDPRRGAIQLLDNVAWLASRDELQKAGSPPMADGALHAPRDARTGGLTRALSRHRSAKAQEQFSLAVRYSSAGRPSDSLAANRWGLAIAERLAAEFPAEPAYQRLLAFGDNNLAWLLATCPDATVQDPARAVELARHAVQLEPKSGMYWNTLGTALHRAGDWSGAIGALRKSNELDASTVLGFNAYFLAMAHHRRGESVPARIWFDISGRWHHRVAPTDQELTRFRAEAEGLLGLGSASDRKEEHPPDDDATLARLVLEADPTAAWARSWLEGSRSNRERPPEPPASACMPNGPQAFAQP